MVDPGLNPVHQLGEGSGVDESSLALIDTACTMSVHSTAWRVAFCKHLPDGRQCYKTDKMKRFHFAGGGETPEPCPVWVIPISFDGRDGEVHSTEVPTGTTPLLLSISVLEALDAVVHVKDMMMDLRAMKLQLRLIRTGSRHLAIDVSRFSGGEAEFDREEFGIKSQKGDVFIYLVEEAQMSIEYDESLIYETGFTAGEGPQLGDRGVRCTDKRGEQEAYKAAKLKMVGLALEKQDAKTWSVLKIDYTLGETHATRGFRNTVIFEPWGGTFPINKMSSKKVGWTNSQPLDKIDGYDLLTEAGEEQLFHILETHDPHLNEVAFDCRICSIMTNMNPSISLQLQRYTTGPQTLHLVFRICRHRLEGGRQFLIEQPATALSRVF